MWNKMRPNQIGVEDMQNIGMRDPVKAWPGQEQQNPMVNNPQGQAGVPDVTGTAQMPPAAEKQPMMDAMQKDAMMPPDVPGKMRPPISQEQRKAAIGRMINSNAR